MCSDVSLGIRDLSSQDSHRLLRLPARTGDMANAKPSRFQGFHGIAILF